MATPTFITKQKVTFQCVQDCQLGAYTLKEGEPLRAASNGQGQFNLFTSWSDGQSIGVYNASTINRLAGEIVVQ